VRGERNQKSVYVGVGSANWGLQCVCVSCLSVSRLCHRCVFSDVELY